ncbi:transposable element Tcb1 transposase [Trichonephila clavipes]|nr:transposable element Tcb1 transposase [Trichonephila clavipes]
MIVRARLSVASVTEAADLWRFARSAVSAVMTALTKEGKMTSLKHNSGQKSKLADRDRRVLKHILTRKHTQSLSEITFEMNNHLQDPVSTKTVTRELQAANIYGRVAIRKPLTTGSVYVWITPREAFTSTSVCLLPTVKHRGGCIMVWDAISWRGLGPLVNLHGRIKFNHYLSIQGDHVHPFVQTVFPNEQLLFQDDNAPIHAVRRVQAWFEENDDEVEHLACPPQYPDLNIIKHLWEYLESKLRSRFPPPFSLSK